MTDPVYTAKALALLPRHAGPGTWCSGTPEGSWTPSRWPAGWAGDGPGPGPRPARRSGRPRPGTDRGRVRAGERRRPDPASRHEPGRPRPSARPGLGRGHPAGGGPPPARRCCSRPSPSRPSDFPYDPANGEPYNSRERYFVSRAGDVAGWLHAGRPRREAVRVAFRLRLRGDLADLIEAAAGAGRRARGPRPRARRHADGRPDVPAARAAIDVRPLRAVLRVPGAARRPPAERGAGLDRRQPGRGGLRERHPAARRPAARRRPCWASAPSPSTPATRCGRSTGCSTWSARPRAWS